MVKLHVNQTRVYGTFV